MIWLTLSFSVLVSLGVSALYVQLWRRRIRRDLETDAIIGKLRREVGEMVTELNGTTERNIAILEDRISALNKLVDRAGKTTAVLRRESEKHDLASQVYTSLGRSRPVNALNLDVIGENDPPEVQESPSSQQVKESDSGDVETNAARKEEIVDFESLSVREKAMVLHRNGESPEAIGAALEMSRGEVELIISLHDRRRR